jgi:hypothetical protein
MIHHHDDDDNDDFPPTAHPVREFITLSIFIICLLAGIIWIIWKALDLL